MQGRRACVLVWGEPEMGAGEDRVIVVGSSGEGRDVK
jgi:hypothetical protein